MNDEVREALEYQAGVQEKAHRTTAAPVWMAVLFGLVYGVSIFVLALNRGGWQSFLTMGGLFVVLCVLAWQIARLSKVRPAMRQDPFTQPKVSKSFYAALSFMLWPLFVDLINNFFDPMPVWPCVLFGACATAHSVWMLRSGALMNPGVQ